ncbi:MAG TPA: hypothetical protein VFW65_08850 [Pseudonocardiaceae bacterium]|nr:hypothetical protein [Pseudonocardiaceae bacterium]
MTQRWKAAGWLGMLLAVAFATVSLVLALHDATVLPPEVGIRIDLAPNPIVPQATGLLRSVVFGVLAGVAFFTGLACFFWSAVVQARQQRAELITLLERWAEQGRFGTAGA